MIRRHARKKGTLEIKGFGTGGWGALIWWSRASRLEFVQPIFQMFREDPL